MPQVRFLGLFPWCLEEGQPTTTDIVATKRIACAVFWRVRQWTLTVDYSASYDDGNAVYDHGTFNDSIDLLRGEVRTDEYEEVESTYFFAQTNNERNLVCSNDGLQPGENTVFATVFRDTPVGSFRFDANILFNASHLKRNGSDFFFRALFEMSTPIVSPGADLTTDTPTKTFSQQVGVFTFSVLDFTHTRPIYIQRNESLAGFDYQCDVTISPKEYWTYGGTYDAGNGNVIQAG